jgi:hypothetical protein
VGAAAVVLLLLLLLLQRHARGVGGWGLLMAVAALNFSEGLMLL